jgi:hypothetical protein
VAAQPDDRRSQPNVVTQPVDAGQQTVETVERVLDASPVRKLPGTLNTVPLLGDTARNRIVPPVRPR